MCQVWCKYYLMEDSLTLNICGYWCLMWCESPRRPLWFPVSVRDCYTFGTGPLQQLVERVTSITRHTQFDKCTTLWETLGFLQVQTGQLWCENISRYLKKIWPKSDARFKWNEMLDFVLNLFYVTFRCLFWETRWSFLIFAWNFKDLFENSCCNDWSNVRILWWVLLLYIFCRRWIVYFPLFSQHFGGYVSCTLCSSCLSIFKAYKAVI